VEEGPRDFANAARPKFVLHVGVRLTRSARVAGARRRASPGYRPPLPLRSHLSVLSAGLLAALTFRFRKRGRRFCNAPCALKPMSRNLFC
jgi:hypothetical protein